jgi:hypothetical protein
VDGTEIIAVLFLMAGDPYPLLALDAGTEAIEGTSAETYLV